ncbi:MAG: hypothetical protein GY786_24550 [Proteobacteria bacterium]|nr:hypothetical protein [Pseudomonadota bacterium]
MKKRQSLFLLIFFISSLMTSSGIAETHQDENLTVLITSDQHNWLSTSLIYPQRKKIGLIHLASAIEMMRDRYPQSILIDGGDLLQGAPLAHFYNHVEPTSPEANPFFKLFKQLNYDAVVVGNHDLEITLKRLKKYIMHSNFPWLGANVRSPGEKIFEPYVILNKKGLKIAILGITTPGVHMWVSKDDLGQIEVQPISSALKKWTNYIRKVEQPDLLIGLFHVGFNQFRDNESSKINRLPPASGLQQAFVEIGALDLVITGHDHRLFPRKTGEVLRYFGGIPVIGGGRWGEALIKLNLLLKGGKIETIEAEVIPAKQSKLIVSNYLELLPLKYKNYLAEKLPWLIKTNKKKPLQVCINNLLAISNLKPGDFGSLFPPVKIDAMKYNTQKQITRAHLFRWIKYSNKGVGLFLSKRDIELLLHPEPEFGRRRISYNQILYPYLKDQVYSTDQGWLRSKEDFLKKYPVKISNYHYNGGGGVLKKILYSSKKTISGPGNFIRNNLFNYLKIQSSLPPECKILEYVGI